MTFNLPRPRPEPVILEGRYTRLEPLGSQHVVQLFDACAGPGNQSRFDFLLESPPQKVAHIENWIDVVSNLSDPLFFAVVDLDSGRCEGRQALMRMRPDHGTIELGSIYWGPAIARTRVATEATFLHLKYAFDTLGYRRFEWKCNDQNEASKRAAIRFGFTFEGVFRQHLVMKGANRDTAWYSIIDSEWPEVQAAYERWLEPNNFNEQGLQVERLQAQRT